MMSDRGDQIAGGFRGRRKPQAGERPVTTLNTCSSFRKSPSPTPTAPHQWVGGGTVLVVGQCGRELLRRFESPLWAFAVNVFVYCLCIQGSDS